VADRIPVSVVVPTRDRPDKLARCLESVAAALREGDELVVVDSASRDPRVAEVAAAAGARVLRCDEPGVDRARNAGWRATSHDLVLFVDDDVTVDPGWADAFAAAVRPRPRIGFVTGRLAVPPEQAGVDRPVAVKDDDAPAMLTASSTGTLGHSASLAVPRAVLDLLDGFDEALGAGARFCSAPEVDLFDRAFAAGLVGRYEPRALAWHDQWRDRGDKVVLDWRYGVGSGARIAKLLRSDRRRAAGVAADVLWRRGLRGAVADLRNRYELGAATKLARVAGTVAGLAAALPVPVRDGHFAPRSARSSRRRP
jgi:glycosyltransferase involved in cell wall biosynthesis